MELTIPTVCYLPSSPFILRLYLATVATAELFTVPFWTIEDPTNMGMRRELQALANNSLWRASPLPIFPIHNELAIPPGMYNFRLPHASIRLDFYLEQIISTHNELVPFFYRFQIRIVKMNILIEANQPPYTSSLTSISSDILTYLPPEAFLSL